MSKPAAHRRSARDRLRLLGRLGLESVRRSYAVAVIAVVAWLSFLALRYLVVTLMFPAPAPAQITGIPTRLTESVLRTDKSAWRGVTTDANPRTPPAHYHRIAGWIQPDRFNGCTTSGCHDPLPHARRKEVRAFLNMHATSLHCGVCHLPRDEQPLAVTWYDLGRGEPRGAPEVVQLYAWLTSEQGRAALADPTPAIQTELVARVREAARQADYARALVDLADQLAAERYSSPAFAALVETARTILPRHFRGEYGAKLALLDRATKQPILGYAGTQSATDAYLREAPQADAARRAQLLAAVHPALRTPTLHCTDCHRMPSVLFDFAAAGYPPARIEMLSQPVIFQMIEHIAAGQPFYLPGFVVPTTQPP